MFDTEIASAASTFSVPESWIKAFIQVESDWNPNAYNPNDPTGAWGLMQLLYSTAQGLGYSGSPEGLFDPAVNVHYGAKLIRELMDRFGGDFRYIASAYNSGSPDAWKTSAQVAAYVENALAALGTFVLQTPWLSGGAALIVVLMAVWLLKRGF